MKEYLNMSDVFPDGVYVGTEEWMNEWFEVRHVGGSSIDESCDGGYSERDANYIAHAINSHDELVAEVERLRELDKSKLLLQYRSDLSNWVRLSDLHNVFSQFSRPQLKMLFWKRDERKGLNECCKMLGKYMYVNTKIFSLWLSGELDQK